MENLARYERLIALLYDLGVATLDQLLVLTGWTRAQINHALNDIRNMVPTPERLKYDQQILKQAKAGEITMDKLDLLKLEASIKDKKAALNKAREEWLVTYQAEKNGKAFYTLGSKGTQYATLMREEPFKKWKMAPKQQTNHYYGVNQILVRLRRMGILEKDWLCGRETERELYYYFNRYKKKNGLSSKTTLYFRPDACLILDDHHSFFIEYDTGSESPARLRQRFANCLRLYQALDEVKANKIMLPIVWVTVRESRKKRIEEVAQEVLQDYKQDHDGENIIVPPSVCFVEGEDTKFFAGQIDPKPFWS